MNFGNVFFSPNFDVPQPREIGKFSDTKPGSVSSGSITVLDDKTVFIEKFSFDGLASGKNCKIKVNTYFDRSIINNAYFLKFLEFNSLNTL